MAAVVEQTRLEERAKVSERHTRGEEHVAGQGVIDRNRDKQTQLNLKRDT